MTARTVTFLLLAHDQARQCLEGAAVLPTDRGPVRARCPREQRRRWLKFGRRRDRRAAQDRSGKARTSPTHPSGGISRGARDGRRARHLNERGSET